MKEAEIFEILGNDEEVVGAVEHRLCGGMNHNEQVQVDTGPVEQEDAGYFKTVLREGFDAGESDSLAERRIGNPDFLPAHFLAEGEVRQRAVARVALKKSHRGLPSGSGWGTGFMISRTLFMTNNHVIANQDFAQKMVRAEFNYQLNYQGVPEDVDTFQFKPASGFYTNAALDFTIVRVSWKAARRWRWPLRSAVLPVRSDSLASESLEPAVFFGYHAGDVWGSIPLPKSRIAYRIGERCSVIQHPAGRRKEIALHDNRVVRVNANTVRYTTDTEGGSSGSCVFNNDWDLVALHHAAGDRDARGRWLNNEGMRMDRIVADIRRQAPQAIQDELGLG